MISKFLWTKETWHGALFNILHTLYHPCSLVGISASFQHLLQIFLQDSQKLEDLKILEVVNIYTTDGEPQRVKLYFK
jgi:energy-converting hydrogenase Eha subunit G